MKKVLLVGGVMAAALAVVLGTSGPARAQLLADAPWPKFQRDLGNTGRSPLPGPAVLTAKWVHTAESWIKTQVSVAHDPSVAGPPQARPDRYVYFAHSREVVVKVDAATGVQEWTGGLGGFANTSTAALGNGISPDYKIYRGERNNKFWSFDLSGTPTEPERDCVTADCPEGEWTLPGWPFKIPHDGDVFTSPTITPDGTIYTACGCLSAGLLFAFRADGSQKWDEFKIGQSGMRNSSPAVVVEPGKNVIFIGSTDGYLSRIDDSTIGPPFPRPSEPVWRQRQGTSMKNSSPSVENGRVYMGSNDGVAAYDAATGARLWHVLTETAVGEFDTTPAIGPLQAGGWRYIYASAFKNGKRAVYRIRDDATPPPPGLSPEVVTLSPPLTSAQTLSYSQSPSPVVDGAGNVYAGVGKVVKRFSPAGVLTGEFVASDDIISVSLGNGVMYVTDRNNNLYAVGN